MLPEEFNKLIGLDVDESIYHTYVEPAYYDYDGDKQDFVRNCKTTILKKIVEGYIAKCISLEYNLEVCKFNNERLEKRVNALDELVSLSEENESVALNKIEAIKRVING